MKSTVFIILALFGVVQTNQTCDRKTMNNSEIEIGPTPKAVTKFDRLPENIKLDTQVRKDVRDDKGQIISFATTTVEKRLNELKAHYKNDRLVDGKGKEIRFFDPLCRGASGGIEEDQKAQKQKDAELAELEKKYTVIVVLCDPRNVL